MRNKKGFLSKFDNMLMISYPIIEGKGEDNYYCFEPDETTERAVIGVFDGSGGLGSRTHKELGGYTEAYLGSRALSGALHDWTHKYKDVEFANSVDLRNSLNECFQASYGVVSACSVENTRIRGALVRSFPSTAAIAIADNDPEGVRVHVIWVGDSRVYLMDQQGLAQITIDDVETTDALDNLTSDGVLKNVMAADGRYDMHYRNILIREPAIVFAASDGCFGYLPTPMEFEFEFLNSLCQSETPLEFRDRMKQLFEEVAGDDSTMCTMSFMFGSFKEQKKKLRPRLDTVFQEYVEPIVFCRQQKPGDEQAVTRKIWDRYRGNYERFFR